MKGRSHEAYEQARGGASRGARARERERECGSATPIVVTVLAALIVVGLAAVEGGAVTVASARTEAAADLSALAAARVDRDARARGASSADALRAGCEAAAQVASRNGVALSVCERGQRLTVTVTVELSTHAWPRPLRSTARAGAVPG